MEEKLLENILKEVKDTKETIFKLKDKQEEEKKVLTDRIDELENSLDDIFTIHELNDKDQIEEIKDLLKINKLEHDIFERKFEKLGE